MPIDHENIAEVKTLHVARIADLPSLLGAEVVTPWFQMDEDRADQFERGTYLDAYPHPYEEEPDEGYGAGLVEGFHLLGMIDFLMNHVVTSQERMIPWNYGLDRVRFVSVIRSTDRYRLRGTMTDAQVREGQGVLVSFDLVGEVEGRERPGFVATQHALWTPLDAAHEVATAASRESAR